MTRISPALRGNFSGVVPDDVQEDFLAWLAERDEAVHAITGAALHDFENPGWRDLWDQDASIDECLEDLAAVDFLFETCLLAWHGERDAA